MTNLIIKEVNVQTGEEIEREMTKSELTKYQNELQKIKDEQTEVEAKAVARQAILDRLGLTTDEAKLILG